MSLEMCLKDFRSSLAQGHYFMVQVRQEGTDFINPVQESLQLSWKWQSAAGRASVYR